MHKISTTALQNSNCKEKNYITTIHFKLWIAIYLKTYLKLKILAMQNLTIYFLLFFEKKLLKSSESWGCQICPTVLMLCTRLIIDKIFTWIHEFTQYNTRMCKKRKQCEDSKQMVFPWERESLISIFNIWCCTMLSCTVKDDTLLSRSKRKGMMGNRN